MRNVDSSLCGYGVDLKVAPDVLVPDQRQRFGPRIFVGATREQPCDKPRQIIMRVPKSIFVNEESII